ncbi:MAG: hypothetical protein JJE17_07725 [Peptostreptococcaceae bacterium]|nr:hypothetical protein [Peptostreptococcaceae bacterium]
MNKRIRKKMYNKYIEEVLIEVSDSSHFRKLFLEKEPFETMDLDVTCNKYKSLHAMGYIALY